MEYGGMTPLWMQTEFVAVISNRRYNRHEAHSGSLSA
jgi:hypothetical protein